jgi:hypothetical protein
MTLTVVKTEFEILQREIDKGLERRMIDNNHQPGTTVRV